MASPLLATDVTSNVYLLTAFGAGVISFLSPCVLPLVPPYLGYLGGTTIEEMTGSDRVDARLWRRVGGAGQWRRGP